MLEVHLVRVVGGRRVSAHPRNEVVSNKHEGNILVFSPRRPHQSLRISDDSVNLCGNVFLWISVGNPSLVGYQGLIFHQRASTCGVWMFTSPPSWSKCSLILSLRGKIVSRRGNSASCSFRFTTPVNHAPCAASDKMEVLYSCNYHVIYSKM